MSNVVERVRNALWGGGDPFQGFPEGLYLVDIQGWNSTHPYLSEGIERLRPEYVVEVGVWKGASTLFMAGLLKQQGIDGVVIAVDTWLGSWDHWLRPGREADLSFDRGYPRLFEKFSANVVICQLRDHVVPLPLDSANAAIVVRNLLPPIDMIHLDAAHDYASVRADLDRWWPLLRPGGLFVGDDYYANGEWPEVKQATDDFLSGVLHQDFEHGRGKWRTTKVV